MNGLDEFREWLQASGFKIEINNNSQNDCDWRAYRRATGQTRECETNDGKLTLVVNPYLNRAVTGMSAKQFKEKFNCGSVRDNLTQDGKKAMLALQRANTALLDLDMDYQERKDKLGDILKNRFTGRMLIESGTECQRLAA